VLTSCLSGRSEDDPDGQAALWNIPERAYAGSIVHGRSVAPAYHHPAEHGYPAAILHLRSHHPSLLARFARVAQHAAAALAIPTSGVAMLPTQRSIWTVPKSPFVFKTSQENFERRVHKRALKAYDAHPAVVDAWVRFLHAHADAGVGVRVVRWERAELGVGAQALAYVVEHDMGRKRSAGEKVKAMGDKIVQRELEAPADAAAPSAPEANAKAAPASAAPAAQAAPEVAAQAPSPAATAKTTAPPPPAEVKAKAAPAPATASTAQAAAARPTPSPAATTAPSTTQKTSAPAAAEAKPSAKAQPTAAPTAAAKQPAAASAAEVKPDSRAQAKPTPAPAAQAASAPAPAPTKTAPAPAAQATTAAEVKPKPTPSPAPEAKAKAMPTEQAPAKAATAPASEGKPKPEAKAKGKAAPTSGPKSS
jgi:small subunit ribosomal protein S10